MNKQGRWFKIDKDHEPIILEAAQAIRTLRATVERQAKEIGALRADKGRLDWTADSTEYQVQAFLSGGEWSVTFVFDGGDSYEGRAPSIREAYRAAIDAARGV